MIQNISEHKYLFHHGANYRSYEFLGAHMTGGAAGKEAGVTFRVWAPRADSISVVGTFNDWDVSAHPMVAEVETDFQETLRKCIEITEEDVETYPFIKRITGYILRVVAPQM